MGNMRNETHEKLIKMAWEDEDFKKKLKANPKEVIQQMLEVAIPDEIEIKVVEETENTMYLVLPVNPATSDSITGSEDDGDLRVQSYIP